MLSLPPSKWGNLEFIVLLFKKKKKQEKANTCSRKLQINIFLCKAVTLTGANHLSNPSSFPLLTVFWRSACRVPGFGSSWLWTWILTHASWKAGQIFTRKSWHSIWWTQLRGMTKLFNGYAYWVHCWVVGPSPTGRSRVFWPGSRSGVPYIGVCSIGLNSIVFLKPFRRVIFISLSFWWFFIGKPMGMKRIWSGC